MNEQLKSQKLGIPGEVLPLNMGGIPLIHRNLRLLKKIHQFVKHAF
ncbi:hypothetical protein SAMN06265218_12615 [Fodinibius sediminis]|uniref:Uncharacterized protein n=1 Tax=Fodinibius sediminis TaxID=1214077 RepID=A0A521F8Q5_9BACT|nr:hypothetical protein SAMN06265218_12615 [Fodinibius sediminis]